MCAINGFNFEDRALIEKMNVMTRHRGPDDTGIFCDQGISLGHNRLSIIDLSSAAHQPMVLHNKRFTITFNGEIYNFQTLRNELEKTGVKFHSKSDTEVILELFARLGPEMLTKLNGIFALAIWDSQQQSLFLARDHFGVKPLYYYWDGQRIIFSSEAKALFAHSIPKQLNHNALNKYLRFLYVHGPETMWDGVRKLPAGHFAVIHNNEFNLHRYYSIPENEMLTNEQEMKELIRGTLREAVRGQLISDRPVGLFLSGGLDSSVLLALMKQETNAPINTFSVGYEVEMEREKYNLDFNVAARTAAHFGAVHHPLLITGRDVAENFEKCVESMDEPVSNHIQVPTYLLAKSAKSSVAVVLGGDGGDELFGGYDRYFYYWLINRIRRLIPALARKNVTTFLKTHGNGFLKKLACTQGEELFFSFMAQKESTISKFLKPTFNNPFATINSYAPFFPRHPESESMQAEWPATSNDVVNEMMKIDLQTWLPDESLIRSDKLSMAHGLEQRVPFLDPKLVALAFRIPSKYKLHSHRNGKKILRDAVSDMLPEFVLKQNKRGFFSPTAKWIRKELKPMVYEIFSPSYSVHTANLFDWDAIKQLTDDHMAFRAYGLNTIWSLMTLQVWARRFL